MKGATLEDQQKKLEGKLLATLAELGGQRVADDSLVHKGTQLILPETMSPKGAIDYLRRHIAQQEEEYRFDRTFRYRPWDGANALQEALKKVFGTVGIGRSTWSFFSGSTPPQLRSIPVGAGETRQVPWGEIAFPIVQGTIYLDAEQDPQYGPLFHVIVDAPRKHRAAIEGLFVAIEEELESNSIYKGRAIDGQTDPEFLDLRGVDEDKVIYSEEVSVQLSASVWSLLRYTANMRANALPLKRSVLLYGPYGCGKTLAAFLTAKIAEENEWTFIYCRPGKDDLDEVMSTAKLYQPAVVFFEDVDVLAESGDRNTVTNLLDTFDGITAKGTEIIAVMTTNHVDRIHKAMVRPGRLDALIPIEALDRSGVERLIRALVPEDQLDDDVDFDRVAGAMRDFLPAFVRESVDRARRYSIDRNEGAPGVLTTHDLTHSASGLRPQLDLMNNAGEGKMPDSLTNAMRGVVAETMDEAAIDRGGDEFATLRVENGSRIK